VSDAVVIGSGPNGLVAANLLADAGWSVQVLEAADEPGGTVRSGYITAPGYLSDLFSAFYPLGYASPVIAALGLDRYGLRWRHAPRVLAHPLPDGRCVVLSRSLDETVASLDEFAPGDGEVWRRLYAHWLEVGPHVLAALFAPFPPVRPALRLLRTLGPADALRFARFALLPVRRFGDEEFRGDGGTLLLAGNAMHTDLPPEGAISAVFGWLLAMLGQQVGYPVPEGGAGRLSGALADRLSARGGELTCGQRVTEVLVRDGRAAGVRTADGARWTADRAVLADVAAPLLYRQLLDPAHLPPRLLADLDKFQWDSPTLKVDWALSVPVPWTNEQVRGAGTVHLAGTLDDLSTFAADLVTGRLSDFPFTIMGQMTTADPTRSPAGTEAAWGYTHLPRRYGGADGVARQVERIEETVERYAPGFRSLIVARHVFGPEQLERANASLVSGAVNAGTAALHQQLVFRPVPGSGRPETPVRGLYLAGASAHPGGGAHGACGANAAKAALLTDRPGGRPLAASLHRISRWLYR
jgi:phytoene dehydrogenase-like protein